MTREKGEIELARAQMLKTLRTAIRLKHSLAADEELNRVLPKAEAAFDKAVRTGELNDAPELAEYLK